MCPILIESKTPSSGKNSRSSSLVEYQDLVVVFYRNESGLRFTRRFPIFVSFVPT